MEIKGEGGNRSKEQRGKTETERDQDRYQRERERLRQKQRKREIKRGETYMYTEGNERLPLIVAWGLVGQTVHYSDLTNR